MYLKHIRLSLFLLRLFFCNSPYTFHLMGSILSERQFQAEVNIPHYASFKDRRAHFTEKKHFLLNFHFCQKLGSTGRDICSDCRHKQGNFRTMIAIQIMKYMCECCHCQTILLFFSAVHLYMYKTGGKFDQFFNLET